MTPVWQNITGRDGNCMQATVASLLDLSLDQVPNFKTAGKRALRDLIEFMRLRGYSFVRLSNPRSGFDRISSEPGVNGYFFGIVRSLVNEGGHHAVVVDGGCNIVHPVNRKYEGIREFEKRSEREINGLVFVFVFNPALPGDTEESLRRGRLAGRSCVRSKMFELK